jgi:1-acyl-sn-glycerol-3-phosphate acyltransferase
VLRGARQIPVYRETPDATASFSAAVEAVRRGECVCVYPEGTLTRDPDLWPMAGKTGAARVALATGAPVVPVAQWGAQEILPPYTKRLRVLPPRRVAVIAGPPVDLSDLSSREVGADDLHEATERIMAAITEQLTHIRDGGRPPRERFDPKQTGLPVTGDPRRPRRGERT